MENMEKGPTVRVKSMKNISKKELILGMIVKNPRRLSY